MNDIAQRIEQCCKEVIKDYIELQKDPQVRLEEKAAGMLRAAQVYDEASRYEARYRNFCEDKNLENPRDLWTELVEEKCKEYRIRPQTIFKIIGHVTLDAAKGIRVRQEVESARGRDKSLHPMAGMQEPYLRTYLM